MSPLHEVGTTSQAASRGGNGARLKRTPGVVPTWVRWYNDGLLHLHDVKKLRAGDVTTMESGDTRNVTSPERQGVNYWPGRKDPASTPC